MGRLASGSALLQGDLQSDAGGPEVSNDGERDALAAAECVADGAFRREAGGPLVSEGERDAFAAAPAPAGRESELSRALRLKEEMPISERDTLGEKALSRGSAGSTARGLSSNWGPSSAGVGGLYPYCTSCASVAAIASSVCSCITRRLPKAFLRAAAFVTSASAAALDRATSIGFLRADKSAAALCGCCTAAMSSAASESMLFTNELSEAQNAAGDTVVIGIVSVVSAWEELFGAKRGVGA